MKRNGLLTILSLIFVLSLALSLVACGEPSESSGSYNAPSNHTTSSSVKTEATLTRIAVTTVPVKTDYLVGETFNAEGMVVTAYYSDDTSKTVTSYTCSPSGALTASNTSITISYTEKGVRKTTSLTVVIGQPADENVRSLALIEVTDAFDKLDKEDYSSQRFEKLVEALNSTVRSINAATTNEGIERYKNTAIAAFESAVTKEQAVADTFINTYTGNYEFDKDAEGHLLIQYNGYPGSWKYVGNKSITEASKGKNVFRMTVKNNYAQVIKVNVQLTDGGSYKVETGVVTLGGLETREFVLEYSYGVSKFYFFVDSCDEHNRKGEVALIDARFELDQSQSNETELYEPKTVTLNKTVTTSDQATYTLTEADHPFFIGRIDFVGKVHFNGNGDSKRYFGFRGAAGSNKISVSDSGVHAASIDGGNAITFSLPIDETTKLSAGATVSAALSYAAEGLTFEINTVIIRYTTWEVVVSETLTFGSEAVIYDNGAATQTFEIPYSSFAKKGRVIKAEITFDMTNSATYSKSQIYIKGFPFNNGIGNNVLNNGGIMEKSDGSTPVDSTGVMTIYPSDDSVVLTNDSVISFDCWWSCASYIKIASFTLYTENMQPAEPITALDARPLDEGVYLSWNKAAGATEYVVYVDGEEYGKTSKTYFMVTGLTNGNEYEFTVFASNSVGRASGVSTNTVPAVGEDFDEFIDALDNSSTLENLIGTENMQVLYDACVYNEGNNSRLLQVIDNMRNGVSQTVCYVGGSITVGENATLKDQSKHQKGYAYYSYQWLKSTFDSNGNSKFVNASISGTGSEIAVVRAKKDIYAHNPNLIFIEFAANNSSSEFYKQTFEGLLRNCLNLPTNPAVVINVSCTTYTHNSGATKYIYALAKYYDVPAFSIDAGLYEICDGTIATSNPIFNAFISDGTHPNDEGHVLYAKCLASFLRRAVNKAADAGLTVKTTPLYSANYDNFFGFDSTDQVSAIKSLGSFASANTATSCTSLQSDVTAFKQGWKKSSTTANEAMVLELSCKNFIIVFCNSNPASHGSNYVYGTVSVKVTNLDTSAVNTLTYDIGPKGWDNAVALSVIAENSSSNYRIEISFTDASGTGNIFGMGYTA
ncbi:MAG: bacterial Ig-like domain-containing protein [Clostridia bacterium]|nr:bacterial Ig-like domain-containing protein [Clostridia bacterium]